MNGGIELCGNSHIFEEGTFVLDARGFRRCLECRRLHRLDRGLPAPSEPIALTYDREGIKAIMAERKAREMRESRRRQALDEFYGYYEHRLADGVLL